MNFVLLICATCKGLFVQPGTTEDLHNAIVFADPQSQSLGRQGLLAEETSKDLTTRYEFAKLNKGQFKLLDNLNWRNQITCKECEGENNGK